MGNYTTVRQRSEFSQEIKKSRFIGYAAPLENEAAVRSFLQEIKSLHPQARHHVYAWRLGGFSDLQLNQRYSDDGEPSGTGGLPLLKKLDMFRLTQTALVVVRYFGGILLGTGGLSRAYASTGEGALVLAKPQLMQRLEVFATSIPYALYELAKSNVQESGMQLFDEEFGTSVNCKLACAAERVQDLEQLLQELGAGSLLMTHLEKRYVPVAEL